MDQCRRIWPVEYFSPYSSLATNPVELEVFGWHGRLGAILLCRLRSHPLVLIAWEHVLKTHLLITLTSPDRPGIVERVTEVVTAHGGNWEECRMAHLGGDFAGIVKVSVANENSDRLGEALRALADEQLTVAVRVTDAGVAEAKQSLGFLTLKLEGADHEGIVHKVSAFLAEQQINVETMETEIVHAPITASPLFQMEAQIKPPAGLSLESLTASMESIGEEMGVDITITAGKD